MKKIYVIVVMVLVGFMGFMFYIFANNDISNSKPLSGESFDQDASKINAPVGDFTN